MLIAAVFGGLGNQMFQYAAARAVSIRLGVPFKLDLTLICDRTERKDFTYRTYELDVFDMDAGFVSEEEAARYVPNLWNATKWEKRRFRLKRLLSGRHLYEEKKLYTFEPRIRSMKDNTYIYGYFQNERYFRDYRKVVLDDFSCKKPFSPESSCLAEQIKAEADAVSIHVRRGDYVAYESVAAYHGSCGIPYYRAAIERMDKLLRQPVFYIFSDDAPWAKEHIATLHPRMVVVQNSSSKPNYEDMMLMSLCKHNIIANSSFSWWGAWLNRNEEKQVIAPARWTGREDINKMAGDVCPSSWIRI